MRVCYDNFMNRNDLSIIRFFAPVLFLFTPVGVFAEPACIPMDLPVASIGEPPENYSIFCLQYAGACDLEGARMVVWSAVERARVALINAQVNQEIEFVSDWDFNGVDDVWDYPLNCQGDCEDFALEKRRRLVENGFPSASLTMAIAFHEMQYFPHAVLLVETSKGTWVLDNLYETVLCWDAVPYIFTHREQPDGQWARFLLP